DAVTAIDERARLTLLAEAECLEPRERQYGESVVELGDVDVGRPQVRARPQLRAGILRGHRREVEPWLPPVGAVVRTSDGLEVYRSVPAVGREVRCGEHEPHGTVDRQVAIEAAERIADHRRVQVVL